jgi:hypothetical protein
MSLDGNTGKQRFDGQILEDQYGNRIALMLILVKEVTRVECE